ncbi:MAG TPA: hypothetical protein VFK68_01940, partial [Propionibacteriaceae bacterium]|nr:hypothetical protein [Propionibacteriaceae bacterium]
VPVVVLGGRVTEDARALGSESVRLVCITPEGQPLEEAVRHGPENLRTAVAALLGEVATPAD